MKINLALLPVFAPIIASPALLVLSDRGRQSLMLAYVGGMIAVAIYILTAGELGSVFLLTSTFAEDSGMAPLFFSEHPYGKIAAFGFILVGAFALLYGLQVARAGEQAVALVAIGSAVGIAFAGNFLTLFIFWEFLTVSTAGLILLKGTPQAIKMGYRFLLLHLGGGLILFLGIMQHYGATGSFLISVPAAGLPFFILGIGIKSVFLPLHVWLPWSYPAASFVSSVVLAGLTTKVGVFAVARILPAHHGIAFMGACMALFGAIYALMQSDMRRLLSYHIISQVGFMVAGVGLGTFIAVDGGLLHMVNHMFYKALLFMSAGAIIYATSKEDLHDIHPHTAEGRNLPPIWLTIPAAVIGATVGALAIAGSPLFNGYVSKYLLKNAMYGVQPMEWMLWVAGVGTTLSFCKFVYFGFLKSHARILRELTPTMTIAILGASACCILFGIWPHLLSSILPYASSLDVYSLQGAWGALQIILTGIVVFTFIAGILDRGVHLPSWFSVEYLLYRPLLYAAGVVYTYLGRLVETVVDGAFVKGIPSLFMISSGVASFDERTLGSVAVGMAGSSSKVSGGLYDTWLGGISSLARRWGMAFRRFFFLIIKVDYDPKGDRIFQLFNLMNFDVDFIIFMATLLLLLGASIFLF